MATYTKLKFSASTDGKMVKVAATGTPGTTIHTAHATALDEIWIFANNTSASDVKLTIEWGGTAVDDLVVLTIAAEAGKVLVIAGEILTNSLVVKAFAETTNVINIGGFVNRIL